MVYDKFPALGRPPATLPTVSLSLIHLVEDTAAFEPVMPDTVTGHLDSYLVTAALPRNLNFTLTLTTTSTLSLCLETRLLHCVLYLTVIFIYLSYISLCSCNSAHFNIPTLHCFLLLLCVDVRNVPPPIFHRLTVLPICVYAVLWWLFTMIRMAAISRRSFPQIIPSLCQSAPCLSSIIDR